MRPQHKMDTNDKYMPREIRQAAESSELPQTLLLLGKQHGLTIEGVGKLETLVRSVMSGDIHPNEFVEAMEDELKLEGDALISLAKDVNLEIFLPVRQSLMTMHEKEINNSSDDTTGNREDLLAEIENQMENPVPAKVPSISTQSGAPIEEHKEASHDFIADTIAGNTSAPARSAAIELRKKEPEKAKEYKADPYREQIL